MYAMTAGYKKKSPFTNAYPILTALFIFLAVFSGAVKFTLNFKPLYYYDIDALKIEQSSKMDRSEIIRNYDTLIDYSTNTNIKELNFPSLPMSEEGKIHFVDVKNIFNLLNYVFYISSFIALLGIILCLIKGKFSLFKWSSVFLILLPILLAIPFIVNFNAVFNLFHEIAFSNDYWTFDPKKDPVITILPEAFFMHSAILILAIMLLASILLLIVHLLIKKRKASLID